MYYGNTMNIYYKITMPTPEKAQSLGIKLDGLCSRLGLWLSGIAFGLTAVDSNIEFKVLFLRKNDIIVQTDSIPLWHDILGHLETEGVSWEEISEFCLLS